MTKIYRVKIKRGPKGEKDVNDYRRDKELVKMMLKDQKKFDGNIGGKT